MDEDDKVPEVEVVADHDPAHETRGQSEFEAACAVLSPRQSKAVGRLLGAAGGADCEEMTVTDVKVLSDGTVGKSGETYDMVGSETPVGTMRAALEIAGITPANLANVLGEGLRARKTVLSKGKARKVADYAVRIRYLELAHRLRGDLTKADTGPAGEMTYEERLRVVMRRGGQR